MGVGTDAVRIFDTMTREVRELVTATPGVATLYTCGPTVYNFAHIGNLRTFLFQDMLKRTLTASGYEVRHCMNITDVEDKIIRDSQAGLPEGATNGERHRAMTDFTTRFAEAFMEDLDAVGIRRDGFTFLPKATDFIPQMIDLVRRLEDKGLAYVRDGSVYFRVAGFADYGRLAHLDRDGMRLGTSVDADEYDRDSVSDFVLWKASRPGEPTWDSPWGPGRPGWHIECSAMAIDLMGERLDIHSGGIDLMFPHHENEIAQSEGVLGHSWVGHWVHGEFLLVDGEKMSKSKGNFYTLRDLVARGVDPIAFRYAILSNHYRKLYNFTMDGIAAAEAALDRIRTFRKRMEADGPADEDATAVMPNGKPSRLVEARDAFWAAMRDDLNTPEALGAIFMLISDLNAADDRKPLSRADRDAVLAFLDEADAIFAAWPHEDHVVDAVVEGLINARRKAKADRDWAEADSIRDRLKGMGILLEDRKDGTVGWKRVKAS
jgi:cysteinyl-tRNA synthetase